MTPPYHHFRSSQNQKQSKIITFLTVWWPRSYRLLVLVPTGVCLSELSVLLAHGRQRGTKPASVSPPCPWQGRDCPPGDLCAVPPEWYRVTLIPLPEQGEDTVPMVKLSASCMSSLFRFCVYRDKVRLLARGVDRKHPQA